jgi:hypothetical protein
MSVTSTRAEQHVITRARAVLARYERGIPWPASREARREIRSCADMLRRDLDTWAGLLASPASPAYLHPDSVFPGLGAEDNAVEIAAGWVAGDIAGSTDTLVAVIREQCGNNAAAYVSGGEEGDTR